MAMGFVTDTGHGVLEGLKGGTTPEDDANLLHDFVGQLGDIGEGLFLDLIGADPNAFADEDGGFGVSVGNDGHMHGNTANGYRLKWAQHRATATNSQTNTWEHLRGHKIAKMVVIWSEKHLVKAELT